MQEMDVVLMCCILMKEFIVCNICVLNTDVRGGCFVAVLLFEVRVGCVIDMLYTDVICGYFVFVVYTDVSKRCLFCCRIIHKCMRWLWCCCRDVY